MSDRNQTGQAQKGKDRAGASQARGAGGGVKTVFLNPERLPALLPKWQKLLGKDIERISVDYTAAGVTVELYGMPGTVYEKKDKDGVADPITIAEYNRLRAEKSAPKKEDARWAFQNRFEIRLNLQVPADVMKALGDGSDSEQRAALQLLPLDQRRVMLMSNKQFKTAYPNGVAVGATPTV